MSGAYVAKLRADGSGFVYYDYLLAQDPVNPVGIALDSQGASYLTGNTSDTPATGFPATVGPSLTYPGGSLAGFVAKISADGSTLNYCGYLGSFDFTRPLGIAVNANGSAYVTGQIAATGSMPSFPIAFGPPVSEGESAFVATIKPNGSGFGYACLVGAGPAIGTGIATDALGAAYVTGWTFQPPEAGFPVRTGPSLLYNGVDAGRDTGNAFVAKISGALAVADRYATNGSQPLSVSAAAGVLANDPSPDGAAPLTAALATSPAYGSLALNPDGSFLYTPGSSFAGQDSFTYTVTDGLLTSAPGTVLVGTLPGAPANLQATTPPAPDGAARLDLSWTADPRAKSYTIYQSSSPTGPFTTSVGTSTTPSFGDRNVIPDSTYYYKVSGSNDVGEGPLSTTASATTLDFAPIDVTAAPPAAPFGETQLNVTWTAPPDLLFLTVYRSTSPTGPFTTSVGTTTGTSLLDTGLTPGTTFYYAITTTNSVGEGPLSDPGTGTTLASPIAPPANLQVAAAAAPAGLSQLNLTWTTAPEATGYTVYRSSTSAGPFTRIGVSNTTSFNDMGLAANTAYYYEVTASTADGEGQLSGPASGSTLTTAPTNLTVSSPAAPTGITQLNLAWTPPTGAVSYTVYRSTNPTGPFTTSVGTPSANSFSDTGLTPNTTYYYEVSATNTGGEGPLSGTASSATLPSPPAAPTNLAVSAAAPPNGQTQLNLTWTVSASATSYTVYRSASGSGPFTTPAGTSGTNSFNDTGLTANTTYYYKVSGSNAGGEGALSTVAHGTTLTTAPTNLQVTVPAAPAGETQLNLSWSASPGASSYTVYRSTNSSGPFTSSVGTPSGTSFSDTGLHGNTTYYYQVAATNAGGSSANSATASGLTIPLPALNLTAAALSSPQGQTQIRLTWSEQNPTSPMYQVLRQVTVGSFTMAAVLSPGAPATFTDTGLTPNTKYYYSIQAFNASGFSAYSNSASATTLVLTGDAAPPVWGPPSVGANASGQAIATATVQDTGSGLASITVVSSTNCQITWTAFSAGTTSQLTVTATKINQAQKSNFTISATDVAGNTATLDPVVVKLKVKQPQKKVTETFANVPASRHFLALTNGAPGFTQVTVKVNGNKPQVVALSDGQAVTLDLSTQMRKKSNQVTVVGHGPPGSSATVLLYEYEQKSAH